MSWALLILLAGDPRTPPHISWHASREICLQHAEMRADLAVRQGRTVEYAECRPYPVATMRPFSGGLLQ